MKMLVYEVANVDGTRKSGEQSVGVSIKGIIKDPLTNKPVYHKQWIDQSHGSYASLKQKSLGIVPGQVIDVSFIVVGNMAVLSDIIPSEELAVDFDSIL